MVFLMSLAAFVVLALLAPPDVSADSAITPWLALAMVIGMVSGLREVYLWFTGRGPLVRRAERRQRRALVG